MNEIQRYTNLINGDEVVRNDNGHLVKYKDHLKAIEAKDKEIERLRKELLNCIELGWLQTSGAEVELHVKEVLKNEL